MSFVTVIQKEPAANGRRSQQALIAMGVLVAVLTGTSPGAARAQGHPDRPARTLTLDDALALAESASEQVAIAAAGVARAEGGQLLARSERMPQVNGIASYDRTLKSEFQGLFGEGGGTGGGTGGDEIDFSNLPFGQANVYRLGLSFSQMLYAGGRIRAQERQAALRRESAGLGLSSAKAQATLDAAQAFYDAALTDRIVGIAEETYAQADRSLTVTQEQRSAGRISEFELLRARVARDSLQPSVVRAKNNREVAYLRLKQLLELPLDQPLTLVADLEAGTLSPPSPFAARLAQAEATLALPERTAVAQSALEAGVAEQAVAVARAERRPAIALRSDYGLVDYPDSVPNFMDWRQNWTIGVGLSLPIFNGGRIKGNEIVARAGVSEAQARRRQTAELAALDEAATRTDLQAARVEWEVSGSTIEQAQRAYEIAELRYTEGLSTQLELSDARLQLAQSQVTRAEAARNLQVGRVRFALLPELPLSAAPGAADAGAGPMSQPQPQSQTRTQPAGPAAGVGAGGGR